ncbi:MAG: PQQ-like beta-propeller repeat protein, partial [Thermoplasmatales archaeon]
MKKVRFLKWKHLLNYIKISIVLLISLTLIFSSTLSIRLSDESVNLNIDFKDEEEIPIKPSSQIKENPKPDIEKSTEINQIKKSEDCPIIYGYNAYPGPEGTVYFDVCNCTIEECGDTISGDFLSGGTFGCDDVWYAVQYGSGVLYGIDPYNDCEMWVIGGGGTGMNALAYDPITHKMYGSSDNNFLYEIDPVTGEQELIGPFGSGVMYMIGMAFDADGTLYGWDLSDRFWTIDTETGEATEIGPIGININYACDGEFHKESNILYIPTLDGLYAIDMDTGENYIVCPLMGIEITALIVLESCTIPDHDVSLISIDYPESGYAIPDIPMQVTIKNEGNNTETTDVQMQVINYEAGPVIFEEDFSGEFPPEGWETDYWTQNYSNNSGGESPEAECYKKTQSSQGDYYDNFIQSKLIDCSGFEKINIRFRWAGDYYYPQYANVYIRFRKNSTSPWKNITPWDNPVGENQEAKLWDINCYSFDGLFDDEFQIRWDYIGYYYYFNYLWLDDVEIIAYNTYEDYNETVKDLEVEIGEELIVEFPTWTPPEWQDPEYENKWKEYKVNACTLLEDDILHNNYGYKIIDLYYPWTHDIEVKRIDSPIDDGPGKTYPVQATIKNVGQYAECCIPIDMSIGNPFLMGTMIEEYDWPGVTNPYGSDYQTYFPGYDNGWRDEHKDISYYYGWRRYYGSYSGGS